MAATQETQDIAEEAAWAVVGVLGGTGDQGRGLARRLAMAGTRVIIGSRNAGRAAAAAATCGSPPQVTGRENGEAARTAEVLMAAMPWGGHADLLTQLAGALEGKIVIDCVNPMAFDRHGAYPLPVPEGSAAQQAAALLRGSTVVGAFHHVSATLLLDPEVTDLAQDVLVLGDDRHATDLVQALPDRTPPVPAAYPGRLPNSA